MEKVKRFISNFRHLNAHISDIQRLEADVQVLSNRLQLLTEENNYLRNQIEKQNQAMNDCYTFVKNENERLALDCEGLIRRVSEMRSKLKAHLGHPARVVFLCELPSLWNSFHTIVTEMQQDPNFEVILIRLWCKEYSVDGSYKYTGANFEEIANLVNQEFIDSYDPAKDEWLNLQTLEPDYVFYMRPYDMYREEAFHIRCVSEYTKTCYIPYGMTIFGGEIEKFTMPKEFCRYLWYFFLDSPWRKHLICEEIGNGAILSEERVLCLGYPRMDMFRTLAPQKERDCFTMLWLPRWNTSENFCNFFEYKNLLSEYAINENNCSLILRPHPLCFQNFIKTGELSEKELEELRLLYSYEPDLHLDESGSYLESFEQSDVLIADATSLIAEYYATGKPIIFCKKTIYTSPLMEKMSEGMYFVESWDELSTTLSMLREGKDPLLERRLNVIKTELLQTNKSSGLLIKEQIAEDYLFAEKLVNSKEKQ